MRIEIPATTSGSNARKLANTNARTSSAPTPPMIDSTSTPLPLAAGLLAASAAMPVTCTRQEGAAAAPTARATASGIGLAPNPPVFGVNTSA